MFFHEFPISTAWKCFHITHATSQRNKGTVFILIPHDEESEIQQILRKFQDALRMIQIWAISRKRIVIVMPLPFH